MKNVWLGCPHLLAAGTHPGEKAFDSITSIILSVTEFCHPPPSCGPCCENASESFCSSAPIMILSCSSVVTCAL